MYKNIQKYKLSCLKFMMSACFIAVNYCGFYFCKSHVESTLLFTYVVIISGNRRVITKGSTAK